jgi:hypothetical protein
MLAEEDYYLSWQLVTCFAFAAFVCFDYSFDYSSTYYTFYIRPLNFLKDPRVYKLLKWDNPPTPNAATADPDPSTEQ